MIVNTVSPDAVTNDKTDALLNAEFGPVEQQPTDTASTEDATEDATVGRASQPVHEDPVKSHSAKVELQLHLENGGSIIQLAQVGPDFCILPSDHGHLITAGTRGTLHVTIDGRSEGTEIELTMDVDMVTERFTYRRIETNTAICETNTAIRETIPSTAATDAQMTKAEQERLFWEEVRLLTELRESESERNQIESILTKARSRQRELQNELNQLSIDIPKLEESLDEQCEATLRVSRQLWRLKEPADNSQTAAIEHSEQTAPAAALPAPTTEPSQADTATAAGDSDAWRHLATSELLAGIKGLGKKKLEAICDLAPTVGALEDLRGEGSKQFKQFHQMLPQGCGEGVASMIEDRMTAHIRKHSPNATGGNPLADELLHSIRKNASSDGWQASDCIPDSNDTEHTHLGYAAYNEGKPHSALPTQSRELARQWMLGWVCAEIVKHSPPADSSQASEEAKASKAEHATDDSSTKATKTKTPTKDTVAKDAKGTKAPKKPRATKKAK